VLPLILAAALATAGPSIDPQIEKMLTAADGHVTAADVAAADAYVAAHPDDGNGFAVRCGFESAVSNDERQRQKALADCKTALQLAPQSGFVHYEYADVLYDDEQWTDSLKEYTAALELGETGRGIYWKRCDAYRRTGDLDAALHDCDAEVARTGSFYGYYTRGRLNVERKDYAHAIQDLTTALASMPQSINALYWRGTAYLQSSDPQKADRDFTQAIALGDTSPDTYYWRGWARLNLHEKAKTREDWETALKGYRESGMPFQAGQVQALLTKIDTL
jgi:tetratricopeptide (TPR) repeat protein